MAPKPNQISSHSTVLIAEVNVYQKIFNAGGKWFRTLDVLGKNEQISNESVFESYIICHTTPSLSSRSWFDCQTVIMDIKDRFTVTKCPTFKFSELVWYWQLKPQIIKKWEVPNYLSKFSDGIGYQKGWWSIFFFKFK